MATRTSTPGALRPRRAARFLVALVLAGIAAGGLAAPAAEAAPGRVHVTVTDPLSFDPLRLEVAAADADGWAVPFTGTVTLSAGRTRTSVPVRSATGQVDVDVPTTTLSGGPVTATVVLRAGGATLRTAIRGIVDLPSSVELRGFGCGVVTPKQPRLGWQVVRLNGSKVVHPAWTPAADTYPAYIHTVRPAVITDSLGRPVSTRGTVVITRGTAKVATIAVRPAVRRMLFTTSWPGTVRGRFAPGAYTATLRLTDASGRVTAAAQPVVVARSAAGLCG